MSALSATSRPTATLSMSSPTSSANPHSRSRSSPCQLRGTDPGRPDLRRVRPGRYRCRQRRHVYVATSTERISLAADGTVQWREPVGSTNPVVSVNERGDVAWSGLGPTPAALPTFVVGGSAEARGIIADHIECDPETLAVSGQGVDYLTLATSQNSLTLPFLCAPRSITWVTDHELVASIGTEGGAPLVRLTPPAAAEIHP
jgi:hypothetical protein